MEAHLARNVPSFAPWRKLVLTLLPVFFVLPLLAAVTGDSAFAEAAAFLLGVITLPGILAVAIALLGFVKSLKA